MNKPSYNAIDYKTSLENAERRFNTEVLGAGFDPMTDVLSLQVLLVIAQQNEIIIELLSKEK